MITQELREGLEQVLGDVQGISRIGRGTISMAFRLECAQGAAFLKVQRSAPEGFFEAESAGLAALAGAALPLRIPRVLAAGRAGSEAYLAMEWMEGGPTGSYGSRLGAGLAELHSKRRSGWGWERDGFIGTLPQPNTFAGSWSEFWLAQRLEPQLRALRLPVGSSAQWAELDRLLPALLGAAEVDGASLLHGDLWSGNVMSTEQGPALVDPACYFGHREVDLAMAELFGGFGADFFSSYVAAWPLLPGYEARKEVYQLYYLLVHVNLFSASYVARTHHTLRRVLAQA